MNIIFFLGKLAALLYGVRFAFITGKRSGYKRGSHDMYKIFVAYEREDVFMDTNFQPVKRPPDWEAEFLAKQRELRKSL